MMGALFNGVLRLLALGIVVWMLVDIAAPWLARHEVSVVVRPVPHPIVRGAQEWRT
jgi:hypothetical protein